MSNNERILSALSDNVKIDFDFEKKEDIELIDAKSIKIMINLFEEDELGDKRKDEIIPFRQHEKITSKPVNLIVFFMNLIWDDKLNQKSNYLKFLRSICRYQNKGISLN